ncbi:MAG TPA: twin-arginine translocase TatA/TatE family subunit [Rubrobacteraceae bacterium]|jgi:sec-independent protein translocase protein TatA|nr:twin-arginine translocase TatA/TatE family subunit [Rubrobacteraceae bacterium]
MFELFQPTHLLFVFLVALIVFGPKRLMEMSRSLGHTVRTLQDYKEEFQEELTDSIKDKPGEKHSSKAKEPIRSHKETKKG